MHMVAARLGFEKAMVGTRWATPRPDCTDRLRKHYTLTSRVLCTWWLLGLALKRPWLVPGGPPHALTAWTGLENTALTGRVLCTWWLLGLALTRPWLVPGGPPHALTAWTGLENTTLTLQRAGFLQEREAAWSLSGCMATNSADYYMLVNEWVWSKSRDCLLRPEVDMGSVLESKLGQKWR